LDKYYLLHGRHSYNYLLSTNPNFPNNFDSNYTNYFIEKSFGFANYYVIKHETQYLYHDTNYLHRSQYFNVGYQLTKELFREVFL
jgi:hypothetical protein